MNLDQILGPVYVASSWSNGALIDRAHARLHEHGMSTVDFRDQGRWWDESKPVDPRWGRARTPEGLAAFEYDETLMHAARGALIVLPAGESVAIETGWFAGAGIPTVVWGEPRGPLEIMWNLVNRRGAIAINDDLDTACETLARLMRARREEQDSARIADAMIGDGF